MSSVVQVLSAPPDRRILPVPVQAAFPHLTIQLGSTLGCNNCPTICCVIDTAAALTTGNFHFFAQIAKAYPHTVAAIYSHAGYSPIVLSGIVQQNGESVTTDLTVAFQFHMPYLTREGTPSTLLVATGPHVTVNAILGLPFIQQTRMIIDAADQVAELRSLDAPPFPIDFRRAQCGVPTISAPKDPVNESHFTDIIREITNIESLYTASKPDAPTPQIPPAIKSNKRGCLGPLRLQHVTFSPASLLPPSVGVSITADENSSEDSSDETSDDILICP
jgi:hypothetical protein